MLERADEREYHYSSSPEVTSVKRKAAAAAAAEEEEEEEEGGLGLELGLSLGNVRDGGRRARTWREEGCRILTAKDFPSAVAARASQDSSSSSSSFSPVGNGSGGGGANSLGQVVGWPPIKPYMLSNLPHKPKNTTTSFVNNGISSQEKTLQGIDGSKDHLERRPKSSFVKVSMDGVAIGRKVDLNAHQSYMTLALALEEMFQNPTVSKAPFNNTDVSKLLDGSSEFVLTYKDKDGDWMLVGDVPWGMFLSSVRRLRIMRTSDANGLATRFHPTSA